MEDRVLSLAARVIDRSDREHPADAVLRTELKSQHGLPRHMGREVSQTVFSYYRWWGWLDRKQAVRQQLNDALALREDFARESDRFTDQELIAKAVPSWVEGQMEVTPAWVRSLQADPCVWLRARLGHGQALADKLGDCTIAGEGRLGDTLHYRGRSDLFRTEPFQAGEFELQDIHSQAIGWLCDPHPGQTWWDACAGGGGKTLLLSDLMRNKGLIWASDRAKWRLERLKLRTARAKVFNYRMAAWDGGPVLPTKTAFDGVLIDAPCSNVGTWHRNPHARWTATPADVQQLAKAQQSLLTAAAAAVKPGGRLIYAVCTLTRAETNVVADWFQAHHPHFTPLPQPDPFGKEPTPSARHWFLPQDRPGNGMFVALWQRGES